MVFKAVDFMRKARDEISKDIQGMSFTQEKEYLKKCSSSFAHLIEKNLTNHSSRPPYAP